MDDHSLYSCCWCLCFGFWELFDTQIQKYKMGRTKDILIKVGVVIAMVTFDLIPHIYNYFKSKKYKVKK